MLPQQQRRWPRWLHVLASVEIVARFRRVSFYRDHGFGGLALGGRGDHVPAWNDADDRGNERASSRNETSWGDDLGLDPNGQNFRDLETWLLVCLRYNRPLHPKNLNNCHKDSFGVAERKGYA